MSFQNDTYSGATISDCKRYRYNLWRVWEPRKARLVWIMLNPSTADAFTDDATIRRCMGFSHAWGYGGLEVVNLYGWRATDPRKLASVVDPVGPQNDQHIRAALDRSGERLAMVAWGAGAKVPKHALEARALDVLGIMQRWTVEPKCLGLTKAGAPLHPVRLRRDLLPRDYNEARP